MKLLIFFTSCLISSTYTAPTYNNELVVYTSEYDIVNILFPINALNNPEDDESTEERSTPIIFFILADNKNGKSINKGLYIRRNGEITKLLDNVIDAAAANDKTKTAYFATPQGIFSYNAKDNKAEKYGSVTDNLIGIAKVNGSEAIYVLTNNHIVYKVTERGTKKEKVAEIDNAENIVLDNENNLFYKANNNIYVYGPDGVKKIEGIPEDLTKARLVKPPLIFNNAVPVILEDDVYLAFSNGTSVHTDSKISPQTTAISVEGTVMLYFGNDKKIYEYNVVGLILNGILDKFKETVESFFKS